jgi:hypothetical protein
MIEERFPRVGKPCTTVLLALFMLVLPVVVVGAGAYGGKLAWDNGVWPIVEAVQNLKSDEGIDWSSIISGILLNLAVLTVGLLLLEFGIGYFIPYSPLRMYLSGRKAFRDAAERLERSIEAQDDAIRTLELVNEALKAIQPVQIDQQGEPNDTQLASRPTEGN